MITHILHTNTTEDEESAAILRSFWELEFLGIHGPEDLWYNNFTNGAQHKNGRYEIKSDLTSEVEPAKVESLDETYVEAMLPTSVVSGPGEQKVLVVNL